MSEKLPAVDGTDQVAHQTDLHRRSDRVSESLPFRPSPASRLGPQVHKQTHVRTAVGRHGRRLEYFTIAWNALEGLVAVVAGAIAGSISLVGYGIDSFIEVTSGSVFLWRMSVDAVVLRRERKERRALRVVGFSFLFLASYITYESAMGLWFRRAPEHSIAGIVLVSVSLV